MRWVNTSIEAVEVGDMLRFPPGQPQRVFMVLDLIKARIPWRGATTQDFTIDALEPGYLMEVLKDDGHKMQFEVQEGVWFQRMVD